MNNSATIHAEVGGNGDGMAKTTTQHYMLTCDLEEKIQLFELAGITVPEIVYPAIIEFQIELAS